MWRFFVPLGGAACPPSGASARRQVEKTTTRRCKSSPPPVGLGCVGPAPAARKGLGHGAPRSIAARFFAVRSAQYPARPSCPRARAGHAQPASHLSSPWPDRSLSLGSHSACPMRTPQPPGIARCVSDANAAAPWDRTVRVRCLTPQPPGIARCVSDLQVRSAHRRIGRAFPLLHTPRPPPRVPPGRRRTVARCECRGKQQLLWPRPLLCRRRPGRRGQCGGGGAAVAAVSPSSPSRKVSPSSPSSREMRSTEGGHLREQRGGPLRSRKLL